MLGAVVDFRLDRVTLNNVAKLEQEKNEEKGAGEADGRFFGIFGTLFKTRNNGFFVVSTMIQSVKIQLPALLLSPCDA